MVLTIRSVLDDATLATIAELLPTVAWRDGARTAGKTAARVKDNLQAVFDTPQAKAIRRLIQDALDQHDVLRAYARPAQFAPLLISRTQDGGHYGPHIDNALIKSASGKMRTDLSFTLGLSDPDTYKGGELTIYTAEAIHAVRPQLGELVVYPSSTIHEVTPVTEGKRIVCVGWIQSQVSDPRARSALFDLENVRSSLRKSGDIPPEVMLTLDKAIANLIRLHAEV